MTTVSAGQTLTVSVGQTSNSILVQNGGTLNVASGGKIITTTISGAATISAGGTESGSIVTGGLETVSSGGTASGTVVSAGGTLKLLSGAIASATTVDASGTLEVASGFALNNFTIGRGAIVQVDSGGIVSGTTIQSGGELHLVGGTIASGTTINSGGLLYIASGYSLSNYVVSNGVNEIVSAGGSDLNSMVQNGGVQYAVSGGTVTGATVSSGGLQKVIFGGSASGTILQNGASAFVSSASVQGAVISGGGYLYAESSIVDNTQVLSAGLLEVSQSAHAFTTTVSRGGFQVIDGTGSASTTTLSGGTQYVHGYADGTVISSGGYSLFYTGGTYSNPTIAGGKLEIQDGAINGGTIVFFRNTGGIFQIDGTTMPTASIHNFVAGDDIDLAGTTFTANGTVQLLTGNQLQVTESNVVFDLQMNTGNDFSGLFFRIKSDGGTGTDVYIDSAPVVTAPNATATHNESFAASSLFTVSDPDGDTMATYAFYDATGNGHWSINGVEQASNFEIDVPATNLSQVTYQSGSGNDQLYVRANDGALWSAWAPFTVTAPVDHAPVVTAANVTAVHGQTSVAASNLFTVTDADGDTITTYALYDATGGGHFVVSGVTQGTAVEIDLTAPQLTQTAYQFGAATDQLYVRANDGALWGNWQPFTASPFADHAPVVSASSVAAVHGQASVAASSLFTVTDVDGDTITTYALYDATGSGRFVVGGVTQGTGVEIDLTAAQLASTAYQFGAATDQLYVRANDGTLWGSWQPFTASPFADHAPVVSALSLAAAHNQSLAASSLFTVSDADGDTLATYAFYDATGNGHFVVNGVTQGTAVEIDLTAAQLAQTVYQSGSGTDQLYARANDGTLWSAWQPFTVTAPLNQAPVVTASNAAVATGHSVAASLLFTQSDPNGDTITTYALYDATGSGHFAVNGVTKPGGTEIDLTAAQLAQTIYVAGSATDQLYARANDGTLWGNWQPFMAGPVLPVVTATNTAVATGQSVAASTLFTATDPEGGTFTTYALYDATGSGHFAVNGVTQGTGVEIDLTASQLAQTTYIAGAVTDQLYARANDGSAWSAWQPFMAGPVPPVVTAPNRAIATGQSVLASNLFTASDPDGGTITTYALYDATGSGHFVVNGVTQGTAVEIDLTAAQLAQTTYIAGSATDQLYARANDGSAWSSWQPFMAGPVPPVVTAANTAIASGQSRAAVRLFTASDPDGGTITTYALYDATGSGHFAVNGVTQASSTEIDLTAAQLAQTTYVAGAATDQLYARVNDGSAWSSWQPFMAGPVPPVVTAANLLTVTGQVFAASSLFTASDPDGGTLTTYALYDATGNGHFAVNGVTQASGTEIDLTAAQLAQTTYVAGSATDQLYARANNGTAWSAWQPFTAMGETPAIINAGTMLELASAYASPVTFFGTTGTLKLDITASFVGTVAGMTGSDAIDFTNLNFATIQTPTFAGTTSGGTLTVTDGTNTDHVALLGNYLASTFVASSDGHGGASVIDPPAAANQNNPLAQAQHG